MKKAILITLIIMLLPLAMSAQGRSFRTLYDKYAGKEGYVTVEMSGSMFNVINGVAKDNNKDDSDFMSKIDNLVIIVADNEDTVFGRDVEVMIADGDYKSMTTIRDGNGSVEFFIVEQPDGRASEFMMTVVSDSEYVVMSIVGDGLSIDEISQMARKTGNAIIIDN